MNTVINFENCEAVVMYNDEGTAFKWAPVEKRTSSHIVVLGVNFSLKTGKISKNQNQNSKVLWTPPQFLTRSQPVTIPYKDVAVKVEPFDMNNLDITQKKDNLFSFLFFNDGDTIEEALNNVHKIMEENNIPKDAVFQECGTLICYERPETLEERTNRLYYEPTLQDMKSRKELERCQAQLEAKQRELEEIRKKVQLANQIR